LNCACSILEKPKTSPAHTTDLDGTEINFYTAGLSKIQHTLPSEIHNILPQKIEKGPEH
jgi:hypothetical protein